ncbi:MAG: hypothetical protein WDM79_06195 [Terricaulis sp.]
MAPLNLARGDVFDADRVSSEVAAAHSGSRTLSGGGGDFYAVGGAWRALGRIDIALRDHTRSVCCIITNGAR